MQWLRIHISDILLLIVNFTPQSVDVSATEEQDAGPREGEQEAGPREGEQEAYPPSQVILYWYLSTSSTVPTRYMVGHC